MPVSGEDRFLNTLKTIFEQKRNELGGYVGWGGGKSDPVFTTEPPVPFALEDVVAIEQRINAKLPPAYRQFLLEIGAGSFGCFVEVHPIRSSISDTLLSCFYGLEWQCSIWNALDDCLGHISDELMPIASLDLVARAHYCIGIRNDIYGKILLWDYETEQAFVIADSFEEFLGSLRKSDDQ
jgi:hypothetical protein